MANVSAMKDYALRNADGTYIRRYFEPGFRAEDLTDKEREEIAAAWGGVVTTCGIVTQWVIEAIQELAPAFQRISDQLAELVRQMQGPNDYIDSEWRKQRDRRAHPRAYRGIKQYKKAVAQPTIVT